MEPNMNKYIKMIKNTLWGIGGILLLVACNKDFPNLLQNFNEAKDSPESKDKVLLVIVDGLSGSVVQDIEPENMTLMTRNGLVTYGSLADPTTDFKVTNTSVAASLLTGVNSDKTGVTSGDISTLNPQYPTIFERLKNEAHRSNFYTSSSAYGTYLGKNATVQIGADDNAVVNDALKGMQTDSADLNVVHLTKVEQAGVVSGYTSESAGYVSAVQNADKQIKQLVDAIKGRKSISNENWLVIVTSGKGGKTKNSESDFTAYGDSERSTYTLLYSPKFTRKIIPRPSAKDIPFVGNATRYTYAANNQVYGQLTDPNKFNVSASEDWTITFFAKHNSPNTTYNYAVFLAKRLQGFSGNGWNIFSESGGWGFNSSFANQTFGDYINDGEWHALTVVIKRSGTQDSVYTYTDGTKNSISGKVSQNVVANSNFDNTSPLRIGYSPGDGNTGCDLSLCNLQIYNRAFTHDEVKRYGGVTHIDESFPFWSNLQGYWPGYGDVNTSKLTEKTKKGAGDLALRGPVSWTSFNELVPFFQPPIEGSFFRQVPNAVDVPFMVYQWLGITVESAWNLDGKSWSPAYVQIRK